MVKRVVIDPKGRIIHIELKPPFNYLEILAKGGADGTRGSSSPREKKRANSKAGSFQIAQCDPGRTQLEHRILSVKTLEFTRTISFPQSNKLKRLSTELAFR
jgi:hypothetical protein